jgi:hypothetical protein
MKIHSVIAGVEDTFCASIHAVVCEVKAQSDGTATVGLPKSVSKQG